MSARKFRFTDSKLRKLKHDGSTKRLYFYDVTQPGLTICMTPIGTQIFQIQVWDKIHGKSIVKSFGRYPDMSIASAQEFVAEKRVEINKGIDIVEQARAVKDEDTFDTLFSQWLNEHAKEHKKSWVKDEQQYNLYIKPFFGKKKLSWFTTDKIRRWHSNILKIKRIRGKGCVGKYAANRALALVSTVFNQMRLSQVSPTRGVKKFKEKSRDRFLQPEELRRFFDALQDQKTPEHLSDYVFLSLLTGARRSNVLSLSWSEINFDKRLWVVPAEKSKNSEPIDIPLVEEAIEILVKRRREVSSIFVFPSSGKTGHLVEPKNSWRSLLIRAKITNFRLHDLRRTMGSYQTMTGASPIIIGKTLGHKSQTATAVYARLNLDPVRDSMEKAISLMFASKELPEKVFNMDDTNK